MFLVFFYRQAVLAAFFLLYGDEDNMKRGQSPDESPAERTPGGLPTGD